MTRTLCALISVAAVCLAAAVPSLAATPVVVGQAQGGTPDIAVDSAGQAHIVWDDTSPPFPSADVVSYCRLPRAAGACGGGALFTGSPAGIFGRPHVFAYPTGQVSVFYQRCCGAGEGTREVYSSNGGLNFGSDNLIGDAVSYGASEAAISLTGLSFSLLAEVTTAATVQNADISVPPLANTEAVLGSAGTNQGAIAVQSGGRPVVVYQNQTSPNWSFVWRKFNDSLAPTETAVNDAANWTPEAPVDNDRATVASGPALAGGPGGVFLFYQKRAPDEGFIRKFTGTGWTAPVKIVEDQSFNDLDLYQDDGGRLHAVWSAYNDGALRYRWSDDGVNWSPTVNLARGETGYPQVRVSAAADHQGFAVWNRGGPDVVAVALEALPPLTGGPGGGGPGPVDGIPPVVGGFEIGRDTVLPGEGSRFGFNSSEAGLATLTVRRQVAGLRVRRAGRLVCVPRTRRLVRRISRSSPSPRAFRRALRSRSCPMRKTIGSITRAVVAGQNTITFNGRLAGRTLRPGRYVAQLQIRDAAGNLSRVETLRFRVARPRRR